MPLVDRHSECLFRAAAVFVIVLVLGAIPTIAPADSAAAESSTATVELRTLDDAIGLLEPTDAQPTPESLQRASELAAASLTPTNHRAHYALALIALHRGDFAEVQLHIERAIAANDSVAQYHYMLGNALFATINDAGMLQRVSISNRGRDAFERAVELDPRHVEARMAMGFFYLFAPGIAGGSNRKAKEQADALLAIEAGRYAGWMLHAQIAANTKKWAEMTDAFRKARDAAPSAKERANVLLMEGSQLLQAKDDAAGAIPLLRDAAAGSDGDSRVTALFLLGSAHHKLKQHTEAVPLFFEVLALNPDARNTRFLLGESLEALNRQREALQQYRDFVERFPDDSRAKQAKRAIRNIERRLK